LSRPANQLGRDRIQRCLVEPAQVAALGEVLAEQPVGVLVGAVLPGVARVTEIGPNAGVNQWYPALHEDVTLVAPLGTPDQGYHLMPDLADRAIA
jgi:hypothetical protein